MNHNDPNVMRPNFVDPSPMRAPPRQEKGAMKVDPHQVTEDLCKSVFIHRAVIAADVSPGSRQSYLRSTKKHDEELVGKAGRDLAIIKSAADRKAAEYVSKQERQRNLQAVEDKTNAFVALIQTMKNTDTEAEEQTDLDELMDEFASAGATPAGRATRGGFDRKRKQEEEDLVKQAAEINKMARLMKEQRRQS